MVTICNAGTRGRLQATGSARIRKFRFEAMSKLSLEGVYCYHEMERQQLIGKTLHEKMMLEAESIIQHNWTDVAIHDKMKLKSIPVGSYCYWIVGEMGSYLTPAYCKLSERSKWAKGGTASAAPIQAYVIRWHGNASRFGANKDWRRNHDPVRDKHCYLIRKTSPDQGEIVPIEYEDLANMCVYHRCSMVRTLDS